MYLTGNPFIVSRKSFLSEKFRSEALYERSDCLPWGDSTSFPPAGRQFSPMSLDS